MIFATIRITRPDVSCPEIAAQWTGPSEDQFACEHFMTKNANLDFSHLIEITRQSALESVMIV